MDGGSFIVGLTIGIIATLLCVRVVAAWKAFDKALREIHLNLRKAVGDSTDEL